jgi:ribulose-phosphate 3-epimerase
MKAIAPSILSADFAKLGAEIAAVEHAGAHILHLDIMDGSYVPNISFGQPILKSIKKITNLPIDVHLMIEHPERHIAEFIELGANFVSVHVENTRHLNRMVTWIKELGAKAGVALSPSTPVNSIENIAEYADFFLLMSVDPGYPGQEFIPSVLRKIEVVKKFVEKRNLEPLIEVDGGVNLANIREIALAGADILVAGSSIFGTGNPAEVVTRMIEICTQVEAGEEDESDEE